MVAALTMAAWLTGPEFSVILCRQGRPGRRCRAVLLTHMYTDRDPFPPPKKPHAKQIVNDLCIDLQGSEIPGVFL